MGHPASSQKMARMQRRRPNTGAHPRCFELHHCRRSLTMAAQELSLPPPPSLPLLPPLSTSTTPCPYPCLSAWSNPGQRGRLRARAPPEGLKSSPTTGAQTRSPSPRLHRTSLSASRSRLPCRLSPPGQISPSQHGNHGSVHPQEVLVVKQHQEAKGDAKLRSWNFVHLAAAGPLGSGVVAIESAAKGVAGPVYDCFHRLSVHTLALVDRKILLY
ncbi:uncharacterized protein LOC120691415 isoform X2 [Panicum virgatum]|uniref:uncharacterized protein LOC120691415 isoform X2 n=1 Tax=Panicum virgatum TaxID=38727 RepID=UPI0019D5E369|nr:uncharacterized protein LOC120691415 isoform X2 [Panicum virgatum]